MTNAFALIDRKTKKIVWIGLKKPKTVKEVDGEIPRYWRPTGVFQKFQKLITVTITPRKKKKS